ncbi:Protein OS9-like domain [Dillenia turbinata]|uniref:Protein OS-9 homolog n=1 Tax=Dillenia turbinata TaxID=194707 RepID=A0AAN8WD95_9MAGN
MTILRWLIFLVLSLSLFNYDVYADQIFPAQVASVSVPWSTLRSDWVSLKHTEGVILGETFARSSREPEYKIEFRPTDAPFHSDDEQESLVMPNKNGEKFICFLPKVEKAKCGKPVSQQNATSMILETERRVKLKTPDELLDALKGQCLTMQEGWWSYEFCYQKHLRQVHVEDEKMVQEFFLGVYDAEATFAFNQNLSDFSTLKDPRSKDASQRYHAHQYKNGTICDLTNEPRETEVRFVCSENKAMITNIVELSTCRYALMVQCPTLCKHPLFQEERPVWHTIHCNALPSDYKETKAEQNFKDKQIVKVTDVEYPSSYASEEHAT